MIEIRRNIRGDVSPHHFFIPMPVEQWRRQIPENTMDLTMDSQSEESPPSVLISTLDRLQLPFRSAPFPPAIYWHDWQDYTATPPTSPLRQRRTRMATRTCTPVCCCPSRFVLSSCDTGISKDTIRTCKESGASQSGSLI